MKNTFTVASMYVPPSRLATRKSKMSTSFCLSFQYGYELENPVFLFLVKKIAIKFC